MEKCGFTINKTDGSSKGLRPSIVTFSKTTSRPKETVHDRFNGERITSAFDPAQPEVDRSGVHDGKPV